VKYLLDTNVLIQVLRAKEPRHILERIEQHAEDEIVVCAVVRMELIAGALRSDRADQNLLLVEELLGDFDSLPLDDAAADQAGRVRAVLESAGKSIGPNDLLIAGIALSNNLTLVTHNTAEFSRIPGLNIEDWERPV